MKRRLLYSIWMLGSVFVFLACDPNKVKLPPMQETFSQNDKNPFGAFVLHSQLEQLYFHNTVNTIKERFERTWNNIADTASVYVSISKNFFLTRADLSAMLGYVYSGNTLFISSNNIDPRLLDTLGCNIITPVSSSYLPDLRNTFVRMSPDIFKDSTTYEYFYFPFYSHFSKLDTSHSKILGTNKAGADYIVVFYGKGRFYLHIEPRALSNYFLLQKDNYKYCRNVFSFTPSIPEHVYWDDFYNKRNNPRVEKGNRSGLSVLLQFPSMAWAFSLLLLLLACYIFFGGKRRQRIVGSVPPNINQTLTFAETIGRLYLQKKDNRNIADKIITYFMEHVRNQFFLNTTHTDDDFINTLSLKSGNSKEGTEKLFETVTLIQQSMEVTDQQLLLLNQQVENFYKKGL